MKVKKDKKEKKVKKESEKVGLRLNLQTTNIKISGTITSWQTDGEKMETLRYFIFMCSKIASDCDCSHKIKRHLPHERKSMTT